MALVGNQWKMESPSNVDQKKIEETWKRIRENKKQDINQEELRKHC